ncbi:transposase [Anaeromyxobacter oryzisoli]|uniref:transposase n=1 Tax=Anaeromyxobacter oryzisoli TaxID=2925408 RepID=UPI0038CBF5B5
MNLERAAAEFRAAARRAGPRGAGRRYPETIREAAVEYLRRRRAAGATVSAIARELGVTRDTLLAWTATPCSGMEQAKIRAR